MVGGGVDRTAGCTVHLSEGARAHRAPVLRGVLARRSYHRSGRPDQRGDGPDIVLTYYPMPQPDVLFFSVATPGLMTSHTVSGGKQHSGRGMSGLVTCENSLHTQTHAARAKEFSRSLIFHTARV